MAEETSSGSDDDYIYLQETAQHLHRVKKIRSGPNQDTVLIRIGDIDAFVEPDSGASANVMDEYQFKALKQRSQEIKKLQPSRDTLKTLKSDLTVKGEFTPTLIAEQEPRYTEQVPSDPGEDGLSAAPK